MPSLDDQLSEIFDIYWIILQGKDRISLVDIQAYINIYDDPLERYEIDALLGLDKARLSEWQAK